MMTLPYHRIYLASRSPRRRELLHQIGVSFDTLVFRAPPRVDADVNEDVFPGESVEAYVDRIARAKAEGGVGRMQWRNLPTQPVLSADTTLELDGHIIGKPADAAEATAILHKLSGRAHRVLTAVAIATPERMLCRTSISTVWMRTLSDKEIAHYVDTGEPFDKAGAYGIQGRAAAFIERIDGSYSGIMGLPLFETWSLLNDFGVTD
jgi:septum formation protein